MISPLITMPQGAEWLVILAIVILVFGAAKLPDLARSSGQALRIFKSETKGLRDGDEDDTDEDDDPRASRASAAEPQARELPPAESGSGSGVEGAESTETRTDRHPG